MALNKQNNTSIFKSGSIYFLGVLDVITLILFKYKIQNYDVLNYNPLYVGNIFNITAGLLFLLAFIICSIVLKNRLNENLIFSLTLLMTVCLFIAIVEITYKIALLDLEFTDHPAYKVNAGFFFSLFQFIQFYVIIYCFVLLSKIKKKERFSFSIFVALISLIFMYAFVDTYEYNYDQKEEIKPGGNNIAVIMGAAVWKKNQPSTTLAYRIEKGYELLQKGIVQYIQLTGSNAPGELSEAETASLYLRNKNVDAKNIFVEKKTTSTIEQIKFVKDSISDKKNFNNIFVVSDSYHLARIFEIAKFYNIDVILIPSTLGINKISFVSRTRESMGIIFFWFFGI